MLEYNSNREPSKHMHNSENDLSLKYFDKNLRKHEKTNIKRSIRRRVEKNRNMQTSDMESDTGSDGLAVNSEGSGRSGDWGPPKVRRRSKSYRKRQENRMSLTDSGVSLSKTDLDSLSGLSLNTHSTPEYRQLNNYQKILNSAYGQQHLKKVEQISSTEDSSLEKESERINNRLSRNIEEKEIEILEQCIKNEKLSCDPSTYAVDCSDAISNRQSRFPLPDHLNYPICRYRIKTESNNRTHPLQKLKNGWKKLKSKKLFGDKQDTSADTDCYPEFYPEFVKPNKPNSDEDDSEIILSRLSRNPNQRKNFARRVFNRFNSKSYSINTNEDFEHEKILRIPRSGSTRSVPDALQDMWNKTHFAEDENAVPFEQSNRIHKVISMPSINTQTDKGNSNEFSHNYFSSIDSHGENDKSEKQCNDVADRLSELQITSSDTNCVDKQDRKVCFNETTSTNYGELTRQPGEFSDDNVSNSLMKSPKKFSSCHELYQRTPNNINNTQNQNNKFVVPPMYYQPPQPQQCACCPPPTQQVQFVPYYPYPPNYMYQVPPQYGGYPPMDFVPNFYPMNAVPGYYPPQNGEHFHMMNNSAHAQRTVDKVVAPLDVKIGHEKVAEKRKISEMVFDTFV